MQLFDTLNFIATHPMNRQKSFIAIGRFLRWQLASRLRAEISFDWINGAVLMVRRGMHGATGNIYCGLHEFVEMSFLLHLLRSGDLLIDVGANVGSYTILATKVCHARAVAFEPDPDAANALRRNILVNDVARLTEVHEIALGAYDGEVSFTLGLGTMNHIIAPGDKPARTVPVKRLDSFSGTALATMIKLDVEGFEEEILKGASHVLASPELLAIQSELRTPFIEKTLGAYGFEPIFYEPFERKLSRSSFGYKLSNTLFLRNEHLVAERVITAPYRDVFGIRI